MLALQRRAGPEDQCSANILPCRIHYDGPTKVTKRYWSPQLEKDGIATSYFRGRKLRGKVMKLPAGYRGVVARSTEQYLSQPTKSPSGPSYTAVDDDIEIADEEEEPPEPVKILEQTSEFENVIVWGHDVLPPNEDPFIKGIQEWISFAEAVHGTTSKGSKPAKSNNTTDDR